MLDESIDAAEIDVTTAYDLINDLYKDALRCSYVVGYMDTHDGLEELCLALPVTVHMPTTCYCCARTIPHSTQATRLDPLDGDIYVICDSCAHSEHVRTIGRFEDWGK